MGLEKSRQRAQLALLASGEQLEVGEPGGLPLPLAQLTGTTAASPHCLASFESGLTARVYRVAAAGRDWTLKCKRAESLVRNVDGQTSFLNEVQRRQDFTELKRDPERAGLFSHIVATRYASLRDGIILSPWIEGGPVQGFDARVFDQLFATIVNLELHGLFEWDFCPGNILDDGHHLTLFDFGYMYRFDPVRHCNSNGLETPLFHGIERFETRSFFDHLLRNPQGQDEQALLALYRLEKTFALKQYQAKRGRLEAMRATPAVMGWHRAILQRWQRALASAEALQQLYLLEGFRSNVLDLCDDLHGQSCTPMTLRKADFAIAMLRDHYLLLKSEQGLFFGDQEHNQAELIHKYQHLKSQAQAWQLPGARGGM